MNRYFDENHDGFIDLSEFRRGMDKIRYEENGFFYERFLKLDILFKATVGSADLLFSPRAKGSARKIPSLGVGSSDTAGGGGSVSTQPSPIHTHCMSATTPVKKSAAQSSFVPAGLSPQLAFRAGLGRSNFRKLKLLGYGGIGKVYLVQCIGVPDVEGMLFAMKVTLFGAYWLATFDRHPSLCTMIDCSSSRRSPANFQNVTLACLRVCAVQVVKKASLIHRNKVRRILMERNFMATANHPFTCSLYATFQTNRKLYFITQYCGGGEFFRLLQKQPNRRLPEAVAKFYAAEILLVRVHCIEIMWE